jgi:hypothetical protein
MSFTGSPFRLRLSGVCFLIHLGTMFKRWYPDIEVGELAEAA